MIISNTWIETETGTLMKTKLPRNLLVDPMDPRGETANNPGGKSCKDKSNEPKPKKKERKNA